MQKLIKKHLAKGRMMQVATVNDGRPWICTVYYVPDGLNLYWISTPDRRHSNDIETNGYTAAAIPIQHVPGEPVIGLQMEGVSILVRDEQEIKRAIGLYAERFQTGDQWRKDFIAGMNLHNLYKITPDSIVVFDEEEYPEDTRKLWKVQS